MSDLIELLRRASRGQEEWRVADPQTGAYCINFTRSDCFNPEQRARDWLEDHQRRFPGSPHAGYEVRCVLVQDDADLLMTEAADEIERLRRGEFICQRCILRKNDDHPKADF